MYSLTSMWFKWSRRVENHVKCCGIVYKYEALECISNLHIVKFEKWFFFKMQACYVTQTSVELWTQAIFWFQPPS